MFNNVESIASIMVVAHFYNITPYQIIDKVASVTLQQVQQALEEEMVNSRLALSVVKPAVEQEEKP